MVESGLNGGMRRLDVGGNCTGSPATPGRPRISNTTTNINTNEGMCSHSLNSHTQGNLAQEHLLLASGQLERKAGAGVRGIDCEVDTEPYKFSEQTC